MRSELGLFSGNSSHAGDDDEHNPEARETPPARYRVSYRAVHGVFCEVFALKYEQ